MLAHCRTANFERWCELAGSDGEWAGQDSPLANLFDVGVTCVDLVDECSQLLAEVDITSELLEPNRALVAICGPSFRCSVVECEDCGDVAASVSDHDGLGDQRVTLELALDVLR